ncbi:hypothetical protein [Flavobacterium sp.]|uniref:hypothetical protein n=1 Tax=Flavobacterium sp. TaxID=239 RepID=UPI0028BE7F6A|nr:hypothetical protein [Flavobacterium sp.]
MTRLHIEEDIHNFVQYIDKTCIKETGHTKNVANFKQLISFCKNLESAYNPSNEVLKIEQLERCYQKSLDSITASEHYRQLFASETINRKCAFENLKPYATKIINAFAVSGVSKQTLTEAKVINKKIQGAKLKIEDNSYLASQQSYNRKIEHFSDLINLLASNPIYNPNEEELKVTTLQKKLTHLQTQNAILTKSNTQYSTALNQRNQILYNDENGLVTIAKKVKLYIKSVFGASSEKYRQLTSIEFKVRKTSP